MLNIVKRLFRKEDTRNGLARLGEYSDRIRSSAPKADTSKSEEKSPAQRINSADLVEEFAHQYGGDSEGWPEPDLKADQAAPGDVDFFEQDTGFAEVFPTTISQRTAILGVTSPEPAPKYATSLSFNKEEEAQEPEAPIQPSAKAQEEPKLPTNSNSIRVHALPVSEAGQEMLEAIRKLPALLAEAQNAPNATLETLSRVDLLTKTLKSQQKMQIDATQEIKTLRGEFENFLTNINRSVSELQTMHAAALQECTALSDDNRKALRSQRLHVIEMRRQQQDAYYRFEDEQLQRLRRHELNSGRAMKKVATACVAMLLLVVCSVGVFMRYTSSLIDSNPGAPQNFAQDEKDETDKLNDRLEVLVEGNDVAKPKG